jgi:hypothetical protein
VFERYHQYVIKRLGKGRKGYGKRQMLEKEETKEETKEGTASLTLTLFYFE